MPKLRSAILPALVLLAGFIYVNNANFMSRRPPGEPVLLAHRGVSQQFDRRDLRSDTCTATRMLPPTHGYLENTIPSMRASFEAGADLVEIDVHPTTDGQFAVFHDWTVDCRTEGRGATRAHSMAQLKRLDVGYGYTADGGKTFPFRGKGVGMMPTLDEVLATFPDRRLVINIKSDDPTEGPKLAQALAKLPAARRKALIVYGGDKPIQALRQAMPQVKTLSRQSLKACVLRYVAYGWTGVVPGACESSMVLLPIDVAPWLWGWPNRLLDRMEAAGSEVFVVGPYAQSGGGAAGVDSPHELAQLPPGYSGGIWTNEIELVAATLKRWRRGRA